MDEDEEFSHRAFLESRRRNRGKPYGDDDMIRFRHISGYPRISQDFEEQVRFWDLWRSGQSFKMAEMLATRSFPGTRGTDRAFMQGRHLDGSQFEGLPPIVGREYVQKALAAGVNPTGKWYSGPMARFPGDPRAWVDGLDDVRRIAAERGLEVQGAVTIKSPRYAENSRPAPYRVDPALVEERVDAKIAEDPGLSSRRDDLVHELGAKLAGAHGAR